MTDLIGAHSDIFATILKEQRQVATMATLQELALVTAVIGHSDVGEFPTVFLGLPKSKLSYRKFYHLSLYKVL